MKITKAQLKEIILEEMLAVLEANPSHLSNGQFAKKGQGKVYSLTANAKDDVASDSELEVPARGSITKNNKISSKFGMNSGSPEKQCGRLDIDGSKKKKTRSCKDYPKNYWDKTLNDGLELVDEDINQSQLEAYLSGVIQRELTRAVKQHMAKTGCSFNAVLRGIQAIADAEKGTPGRNK